MSRRVVVAGGATTSEGATGHGPTGHSRVRHGSTGRGSTRQGFAGTLGLLRLDARATRVFHLVWFYLLVVMLPATAMKYHELVPRGSDPGTLMSTLAGDPTMRALLGPAFDLTTPGGFTFWRVGTFTAAAAAMMAALGVIRTTRGEEEAGRTDLLRAGAIGRSAPLAAGLALSVAVSLGVGLAVAAAMVLVGTPVAGSLASGLGITLTATMFAGLGAVCAQVFESARTARAWAVGAGLGGLYLLRAAVDAPAPGAATEPLRWLMPLDWAALARPYAHERWWVLLLPLASTLGLCGLALRLDAARDLGAGLRAASRGSAHAPAGLRGAVSLAWRLERGSVLGWTVGVLASALVVGGMAESLHATLTSNAQVARMMQRMGGTAADVTTSFYQAMLAILVSVVAMAVVSLLARARQEESAGRAEVVLATATSRTRQLAGWVLVGGGVPVVLLVLAGLVLPGVQAVHDHGGHLVWAYAGAALALVPGLLLVVGLAVLLLGWRPRWFPAMWAVVGWSVLASWVLPLFDLPHWLVAFQPWGHLPHLPSDAVHPAPLLVETGAGVALVVVGFIAHARRDIPA